MTKEEQEKEKQEAEQRKRWLVIEEKRKSREKYETKEMSGWMYVGPMLGLVVAAIAGIMIWLSGSSDVEWLWQIVGIAMAPLLILSFTSGIEDDWKISLAAKMELDSKKKEVDENGDYHPDFSFGGMALNGFKYQYGYLYTDKALYYWAYALAKFVAGLSSITFGIGAIILGFIWLGSISIAPDNNNYNFTDNYRYESK